MEHLSVFSDGTHLVPTVSAAAPPYLSIVVPVYNEVDSLATLDAELRAVLRESCYNSEIIYVDDFSTDGSRELALRLAANFEDLQIETKVLFLRRNYGQTAAMAAGFQTSSGEVVVALDADGQNNPRDIPRLIEVLESGYECVSGWRYDRQDNTVRRVPSMVANRIIARLSGVYLHDYGCTLKAYRGSLLRELRLYGDMHRFIPLYLARIGGRVTELKVDHRARLFGSSKYGSRRILQVFLDLFLVRFMVHYYTRPLRFFGNTAFVFGGLALGVLALMVILKYGLLRPFGLDYQASFVETPLPALAGILIVAAVLSIFVGILAELLVRILYEAQGAVPYAIARIESSTVLRRLGETAIR
jgi:glycosyltransferase involved in cell wall biosynthesis